MTDRVVFVGEFCGQLIALEQEELAAARERAEKLSPSTKAAKPVPEPARAAALVDAAEAARKLCVPRSQLERLARQGAIPSHRLGRWRRFDVDEVATAMRRAAFEESRT